MERLRQTHAKEVESRDEEVEEIRQSCQKKVGLTRGPAALWGPGYIPGDAGPWSRSARIPHARCPAPAARQVRPVLGIVHTLHKRESPRLAWQVISVPRARGGTHWVLAPWPQPGSPRVTLSWT